MGISRALQNWEPDMRTSLRAGKQDTACIFALLNLCSSFSVLQQRHNISSNLCFHFIACMCVFVSVGLIGLDLNFFSSSICFSWFFDKRLSSCGKEETWKSQGKKELPMGQTLNPNPKTRTISSPFCLCHFHWFIYLYTGFRRITGK